MTVERIVCRLKIKEKNVKEIGIKTRISILHGVFKNPFKCATKYGVLSLGFCSAVD